MIFRLSIVFSLLALASVANAQQGPSAEAPTTSWPVAVASLKINDTIRVWSSAPAMYGRPLLVTRFVTDSVVVRTLPERGDWWAGVAGSKISAIDVGYATRSRYRAAGHGLVGAATGLLVGGAIGFLIGGDDYDYPQSLTVGDRSGGTSTIQKALYAGTAGAVAGFAIGWRHGSKPFLSWSPLYRASGSGGLE